MSKVSVIAKLVCQEGKRDDFVAAFRDYFPTVEGEDGTLLYSMNLDTSDEVTVWFYELYTDGDALGAHGGSDAFKAFGAALGGMLAGAPELHILTPSVAKGHAV